MRKLIFAAILVIASVFGASAQSNDVRVFAGASNVNRSTVFTGSVEVRKNLINKLSLDNTATLVTDGDDSLVQNQGLLRVMVVDNVFVAGGLTVGKTPGARSDVFLNPSFQVGANFNVSKVNFEPVVQLDTPDLLSDNTARTLSGKLIAKYNVTRNFGLLAQAGVSSRRFDNRFFNGVAERSIQGGVFFSF